jgi:TRAP-type C4-dicarboxylate transport system permease small subunit
LNSLLKFVSRLSELPLLLASAVLFLMMAMTFADVILRSAFDTPIEAATELVRIAMAIIVFSALPVISGRGEHISVDLLDSFFNSFWDRLRNAVVAIGCGLMLLWPAQRIVVLAERAASYGDVTEYLGIPQTYVAWMIAISTFVTALVLICRGLLILFWRNPSSD